MTLDIGYVKDAPALPEAFEASSGSTYVKSQVQGRQHCEVCISLCHVEKWPGAPRPRRWRRTDRHGQKPIFLCEQHKLEYVTRDNQARAQDGLKLLQGGS